MHDSGVQPGFLPLPQAAAWVGVSVRTVRRWLNAGLPKYQAGPRTRLLIRPLDLEAFLLRQQAVPRDLDRLIEDTFQHLQGTSR